MVVREAVDQATVVVTVMSPEAEASEWVDRELARAELLARPLPAHRTTERAVRIGYQDFRCERHGLSDAEPFIAQLMALLRSLIARDQDPYLILDRPDEPGHFAQAFFDQDLSSFQLEHRDGDPAVQYVGVTDDVAVAATVLAGWVDRIEGWSVPLQWEPLSIP